MVSERTLGIITIICVLAVFMTSVIRINGQSIFSIQPLSVVERQELQYAETDPEFLESNDDEISQSGKVVNKGGKTMRPMGMKEVTARAYLVGNVDTNVVYTEYNSGRALPVASMSKLVTAFVATDVIPPDVAVEISSSSMMVPPDRSNLQVHERYTLDEILLPLLLNSSNVAAEAIASSTENRSKFLEDMSSYAWEIGMPNTFFADPSGVDYHNVATARDLFALARYLTSYRPNILAITRIASSTVATTTDHGAHEFSNIHPFVYDPRFVGGKTGRTPEAGETMMTIMDIENQKIVIIVLGSLNREQDTRVLLSIVESILKK